MQGREQVWLLVRSPWGQAADSPRHAKTSQPVLSSPRPMVSIKPAWGGRRLGPSRCVPSGELPSLSEVPSSGEPGGTGSQRPGSEPYTCSM